MLHKLLASFLFIKAATWALTAHAASPVVQARTPQRLILHPLSILGTVGQALRVRIEPPCGSELYGLVASTDQNNTLRLAAAMAQKTTVCASLPVPIELSLEHLAIKRFDAVAPLKVNLMKARLSIAPVSDIRVLPQSQTQGRAKLIYQTRCGTKLGILFRPTSSRDLQVAIVEQSPQLAGAECPIKSHTTVSNIFALRTLRQLAPLPEWPSQSTRQYSLELARVKELDQKAQTLQYERACNEAPVGLVLMPRTKKRAPRIGVLLARYPNITCEGALSTPTWNTIGLHALQIDRIQARLLQPSAKHASLQIKLPTRLAKTTPNRSALRLHFMEHCNAPAIGAVYALDAHGKLAVGVLTTTKADKPTKASPCKNTNSEVSWTQPYLSTQVLASDIFPMKLKGQSAR